MEEQKIENSSIPAQTEIVSNKNPLNNLFRIILLVILGLFLVSGAVYAGMQIQKKQTRVVLPTPYPPEVRPTETLPTSIIDETANWKTYTNERYGFEFKYPQEWELNQNNKISVYSKYQCSVIDFTFSNSKLSLKEYVKEELKDYMRTYNVKSIEDLIDKNSTNYFGNYETIVFPSLDADAPSNTYVKNGNVIVKIAFWGQVWNWDGSRKTEGQYCFENMQLHENQKVQILSTFKFIQPSTSDLRSQVEDWVSYIQSSSKLSWDKCEGESYISSSLKETMSVYPVFTKEINGLKLAYTSKLDFTAQDVVKFTLCEAGNFYPIYTFNDKVLWVKACSTGVISDNSKCEDTLSQIEKLYGYKN